MTFRHLMWLFTALVLLFGVPLLFVEDESWQKALAGCATLSLGGFGLAMAADALVRGQIRLQHSLIVRSTRPRTFWAVVVLVLCAGAGVVVAGLWGLFIKG